MIYINFQTGIFLIYAAIIYPYTHTIDKIRVIVVVVVVVQCCCWCTSSLNLSYAWGGDGELVTLKLLFLLCVSLHWLVPN
jgi:hypothetical protein